MLSNRKQFCLLLHNSELCFLPIHRFLLHLFFLLLPLNSCFFPPIYGISSPFVLADPSIEHLCVFFQVTDFSSIFSCWSFHWTLVCFLPIYRYLLLLFLLILPSIELLGFLPISGFLLQFFLLMILPSIELFCFIPISTACQLVLLWSFYVSLRTFESVLSTGE